MSNDYSIASISAISYTAGASAARAEIAEKIYDLIHDHDDPNFKAGFTKAKLAAIRIALGQSIEPDTEN